MLGLIDEFLWKAQFPFWAPRLVVWAPISIAGRSDGGEQGERGGFISPHPDLSNGADPAVSASGINLTKGKRRPSPLLAAPAASPAR